MKITKLVHSCLLVEMPEPINRTVLFDPGVMSESAVKVDDLQYLDDIIITHIHSDHVSLPLLKKLVAKFPAVRITTTKEAVDWLQGEGIQATSEPSDGMVFFSAPHESVEPLFPVPEEIGVHYQDILSHPGDSHSMTETKAILALPITAPWGATTKAVNIALELKPQHIIPIHDWHWSDQARGQMYQLLAPIFAKQGIMFHQLETGVPIVIDLP